MHEQTAETSISLNIDIVWSESVLSAWTNAQADLSLFGLQAILLVWNDKNYDIKNALCEFRIILNVLIVCLLV